MDVGRGLRDADRDIDAIRDGRRSGRRRGRCVIGKHGDRAVSTAEHPEPSEQRRHEDDRPPDEHSAAHGQDTFPDATLPLYADSLSLAALLPFLEAQVVASLGRRGFDSDAARDAFQDALVRLLRHRPAFADRAALARWLSLVSYRAAEKAKARNARVLLSELVDWRATDDPSEYVEARLAFDALVGELSAMRPTDREVIIAHLNSDAAPPAIRRSESQERVRLHRARRRLRNRFRGWLAGVPVCRFVPQRRTGVEVPTTTVLALSVAAVVGVVASVTGDTTAAGEAPPFVEPRIVVARRTTTGATPVAPPTDAPSRIDGLRYLDPEPIPAVAQNTPSAPGRWVIAAGPADTAAGTSTRSPDDNSLVCFGNVPLVDDRCVEHPLRSKG